MLFLDNNVQHTEYDAHVFSGALCEEAKRHHMGRILVVGGGSGQTSKTLLESPSVTQVTMVEIDSQVVDCCRRYVKGIDRTLSDDRVRIVIDNAFEYLHSTHEKFDAVVIDLTEAPFAIGSPSRTMKRFYADIKAKCGGRCSQYIGSAVDLAYNQRMRNLLDRTSRKYLRNIRYVSTFIPSFGAPHTIMHAGYGKAKHQGPR
jgi:spermidine synthase